MQRYWAFSLATVLAGLLGFYNNAAGVVVITAEAVPEPGTLLLLLTGFGLLFWGRRRRAL